MTQYIDKDALVAEIKRRKQVAFGWLEAAPSDAIEAEFELCDDILSFINTLEVKESQLPNSRFPHLNNIVDKVFGTGNLESWEYEEAKQLVLLAKEELLKDLEVKEVDLESEIKTIWNKDFSGHFDVIGYTDFVELAKHFFELGLKAQKVK